MAYSYTNISDALADLDAADEAKQELIIENEKLKADKIALRQALTLMHNWFGLSEGEIRTQEQFLNINAIIASRAARAALEETK
jgi:hypothetical protein